MSKIEFIVSLKDRLSGLPNKEVNERLSFYSEIIEDRIEEGLSEEDAVAAVGSVDEIAEQIIADIPLTKIVKEKIKPKRALRIWEIVLLTLGSPIWLSLLIIIAAVILSVYITLWAVVVSLWSIVVALWGSSTGAIVSGIVLVFSRNTLSGIALIGAAFVCVGLSIFAFFACKSATKGMAVITKKLGLWIKSLFVKKEEVQ